jgi:hypothetical protein
MIRSAGRQAKPAEGSTECVGIPAARCATRFEALEPIRQGVRQRFGAFARSIAAGLAVRHDHGSQYLANDFQQELAFLGIASSPAFVRTPEGPCQLHLTSLRGIGRSPMAAPSASSGP